MENSDISDNLKGLIKIESDLQEKLRKCDNNIFYRFFFKNEILNELKDLNKTFFIEIDKFLTVNDTAYSKLVQENLKMLQKDNFSVNPYQFARDNYTSGFEGNLSKNGYVYLETSSANWLFDQNNLFLPLEFEGKINHFGEIYLKLKKTKLSFKTLPKKFSGSIDQNGEISLVAKNPSTELFIPGSLNISKLIGKIFPKNGIETKRFQSNKIKLKRINNDYKKQLLTMAKKHRGVA